MKNSKLTLILLISCFALWGVVNNMTDNLVPAFQRIFTMDQSKAVLVQVAFYGAYAVLALFTSILVEEFSFRAGILIGLGVYVCGALLYIPACVHQSFDFYFIGIFVVAGGCAILEASSNSCMLALGDPKTAIRRLNFAQAMNPVGSLVGIFLAQKIILAHLNPATVEERLTLPAETLRGIVHTELVWICVPYVGLCLVMLSIWLYFLRHPIRTAVESEANRAPLRTRISHVASAMLLTAAPFALTGWLFPDMDKLAWMLCGMIGPFTCIFTIPSYRASFMALVRTPRYVFGVIALFAYVGMQIAVWTWMNAYCQKELGVPPDQAATYYLLAIAIHTANCWAGSYAMKWIAPWRIMAAFCVCGTICSLGTIYLPSNVLFTVCGVPFSANVIALVGISVFMAILFPTIYGMALGGLDPKCFKLGGPGMIMAILGGAVITPWMASVISAKESAFFSLVPMYSYAWDANLRSSSGALRASFFIPVICFVAMFAYAVVFRGSGRRRED
ncbi:MAG: MFS transporter [Kiritimatiellae bacterium]|nr:MFS transporter [Kiritimatiellia bacterium]